MVFMLMFYCRVIKLKLKVGRGKCSGRIYFILVANPLFKKKNLFSGSATPSEVSFCPLVFDNGTASNMCVCVCLCRDKKIPSFIKI